ncbi:COX Aromatic Rich Motif protein [compost metagenome]
MTFTVDATSEEEYKAWIEEIKETSPALTMEGYEKLTEPGASETQLFSSFPDGLFEQVVRQYVNGDGGGAHSHHTSHTAEPAKSSAAETSDASKTVESIHSQHSGH